MRDTVSFYRKIYGPLFKRGYTRKVNRATVANRLIQRHDIKVASIIDVGCAWGKTLDFWKNRGAKRIVGIDVSKIAVKYCKKRGHECHLASATNLSKFKKKSFDMYMATDVYEHLRPKDVQHSIEEAIRITKRYIIIRPHPTLDKRKKLHLTIWNLQKWEEFFISNGLKLLDKEKNCFMLSCE